MAKVKAEPKVPDTCPSCSGALTLVPPPTDAQRIAAAHRENPAPLPPTVDTAPEAQLHALGPLYRCVDCDYRLRVTPALAGAAPGTTGD